MTERSGLGPVAVVGSAWLLLNAALLGLLQPLDVPARPAISRAALRHFAPRRAVWQSPAGLGERSVRYCLMVPSRVEPDRTYPLVLFLHGSGERGADNRRQLEGLPERMAAAGWRARYPCYFVAPQCPNGASWRQQMTELERLIDRLSEEHPIDERQIYLTGLSMGGFGSWELASRRPELFAAVVPICGGGDPARANRLVDLPIWAVHGDADEVVPAKQSRRMIEALREAGGRPRYTELPGVGHDSWTAAYADPEGVVPWMFRQRRTRPDSGSGE